jgi:hypothetical protein
VIDLETLESWLLPISLLMCLVGALLVAGVRRRWKWLVDPQPLLWPLWGLSFVRTVVGVRGLRIFVYALGIGLVLIGAVTMTGVLLRR